MLLNSDLCFRASEHDDGFLHIVRSDDEWFTGTEIWSLIIDSWPVFRRPEMSIETSYH